MQIKNSQVMEGLVAITKLDGEENAKPKYKLSALTRLALAKNLNRLNSANQILQKARERLLREYDVGQYAPKSADGKVLEDPENLKKFYIGWEEVCYADANVVLTPIKESDLRLDENEIPVQVLAALVGWLVVE